MRALSLCVFCQFSAFGDYMPELPEVETIRQDLSRLIVGRKILDIKTDSPKQIQPSLEIVQKAAVGFKIARIKRRAKVLLVFLSNGQILAFHLKLTGRLLVRSQGDPKDDWQHITLFLSGGKELRFADLRKFGWLRLIDNEAELGRILKEFGPEPLADLDMVKFKKILNSSSRPIKILLMDQAQIAGIGNIYASDALFLAKIHPGKKANQLVDEEVKKLFEAVEKVLQAGIRYRGASDQYYLDALGHQGSYQKHFLVYGRDGEPCERCHKARIQKFFLGGRGTYFCPNCQK